MSSIQSNPSAHQPTVTHSVDTPESNPELDAANQLAIKKATSLPHFTQSAGAMLSYEEDLENDRKQRKRVVNQQMFEDSLQNLLRDVRVSTDDTGSGDSQAAAKAAQCTGKELLKNDMRQMALMASNLCLVVFAATADAKCEASQIMTDSQCVIRTQKVKQYQQELAKRVKAAKKAKKMGIISTCIDWAVGVAEAAYGIVKLVEGVAEAVASFGADPNAYASIVAGAAYTTAGVAGMVKAAAETAKLCGANPKVCDKIAKIAGWVQLGCEIVGLATDIFGAGLAFKAATGAAKGAAEAATRLAEEAVTKAVAESATESAEAGTVEMTQLGTEAATRTIEEVAEEVATEAAEEIGDSIVEKIMNRGVTESMEEGTKTTGQKVTKRILKYSFKRVTKYFGKDAMKDIIKQSLKQSMEDAAKQAEKGVQRSFTRIVNDMRNKIAKRLIYNSLKVCLKASFFASIYGAGQGSAQIVKGANAHIQAKFQAEIAMLVLIEGLMGLMDQQMDESKKEENRQIKDVMNKSATVMQNAKDTIQMFGMTSVKVAINIQN